MADETRTNLQMGKAGYELRQQGASWTQVAEILGAPDRDARDAVRHYERSIGKPVGLPTGMEGSVRTERFSENEIVLSSKGTRITSLPQLLEACNVDEAVWAVDHFIVNKWEVGAKQTEKDLTFEAGKLTGTVRSKIGLTVEPLFQVKAWLIRRKPEAILPVIHPVQVSVVLAEPAPLPKRDFVRSLVWGDPHFGFRRRVHDAKLTPFHDRRALDLVLRVADVAKPDRMDILGDWFDMGEFTDKFVKSPEFFFTFQPAIYESLFWLTQYRQAVSQIRLHEGNHDKRLPDAVKRHLPFAYGLRPAHKDVIEAPAVLSVPYLLGLEELDIEWVNDYPNDLDWLAPKLVLNHGTTVRARPLETARAVAQGDVSEVFGHIHRLEMSSTLRRSSSGEYVVTAFSPACTCHVDHRVPGHRPNQRWTNGLGVIDVFASGHFSITPIIIENGTAGWNGYLFKARDRIEEISAMLPSWNW